MFRVSPIVALLVFLTACGGDLSFPPPPQRTPGAHTISHPVSAILSMAADQGDMPWASIIQDVVPPAPDVDWRWAHSHPAFRFDLMDSAGWEAIARLTVVAKVIDATGPQHVTMTVNDIPVGKITFAKAGNYDVAFPVDTAVLKSASPAILRLDIDPCLPSDSPSEKGIMYCILLHSVGFIRNAP